MEKSDVSTFYRRKGVTVEKEKVAAIREKINDISFTRVIQKGNYTGQGWKDRKEFIDCNKGCCTLCEKCASPADEKYAGDYQLKYVSHGAHALDFCERMDVEPDNSWNDIPVLFLFENPSVQYGNLYGAAIEGSEGCSGKCPAQEWYWLREGHGEGHSYDYPKYYKQGYYGDMVASLIKCFKLRNAYMTNFVKCAMNNADGTHYLGTAEYKEECISTCFKNILQEEIRILTDDFKQELVVFAFSHRVYDLAQRYFAEVDGLKNNYSLCLMPHPANRLANEYRKYVLFGKVYKMLSNKDVDCQSALKEFLENDKSTNAIAIRFSEDDRTKLTTLFENKEIKIKGTKIGKVGTGTITVLPTEVKCKFKLKNGIFEFGFVSNSDGAFWIWDGNKRGFLNTAEEVSAEFGELFRIFHDYISKLTVG